MSQRRLVGSLRVVVAMAAALALAGCGQSNPSGPAATAEHHEGDGHDHAHQDGDGHDHGKEAAGGHDHSGWWCAEHGVPEGECSQCNSKIAAEFQKKGDWCKEHDRAHSQCFICDPKAKEKYVAMYKAKYGENPPPMEGEDSVHEESKSKG